MRSAQNLGQVVRTLTACNGVVNVGIEKSALLAPCASSNETPAKFYIDGCTGTWAGCSPTSS